MKDMTKHGFVSASIKKQSYKKLSKLAKKERRLLSVMLDILIEDFESKSKGSQK